MVCSLSLLPLFFCSDMYKVLYGKGKYKVQFPIIFSILFFPFFVCLSVVLLFYFTFSFLFFFLGWVCRWGTTSEQQGCIFLLKWLIKFTRIEKKIKNYHPAFPSKTIELLAVKHRANWLKGWPKRKTNKEQEVGFRRYSTFSFWL